ncbi:MAG: S8 family serine peptidase, partial [Candidatus Eisenbacteria bacterium]|nr:S8 family serine peptidase [Candidatus Latescibacterota bacterium]MBD3303110.1 S8 family serine peptidase [Candidatus Eisenbacteria bacterium]
LTERGIEIRHRSRWLRAVSADLTRAEARALSADSRVRSVRPVGRYVRPIEERPHRPARGPVPRSSGKTRGGPGDTDPASLAGADYAGSWEQLEMLGVPELHRRGYSGAGVMIAVFDTGFRKDHASLADLDLVAERDFVNGDGDVQHDPGDPLDTPSADRHGTLTWSTIGGFLQGRHLGAAYRATFVLAKTEDIRREVHLEEDHYIAALEWADSLGADLVSTSLGYRYGFPDGDYGLDELDGETLPITVATDTAAARGLFVVTAMGNDGPDPGTLNAPADGKRVAAVGAVDFSGSVTGFSSRGPTGDGRIKPDVCALGYFTQCADSSHPDSLTRTSGTSLATPLVSGLAALLLEARADWTPDSLLAALKEAGDAAEAPDQNRGWGVPDGLRALGLERDRLRIAGLDWADGAFGDGIPEWNEEGEISLWIRNDGSAASPAMTMSIASADPRVTILEPSLAELPPIAPGDSIRSGPLGRVGIPRGETAGQIALFFRFEGGPVPFERKRIVPLAPPETSEPVSFVSPNPVVEGPVRILLAGRPDGRPEAIIYAVDGRRVRHLAPESDSPSVLVWDLKNENGRSVGAGIYLVRQPGGETGRICVLR